MQEDWKVRFFLRDCGAFIVGTVSDGCRLQLTFLVLGSSKHKSSSKVKVHFEFNLEIKIQES